MASRALQPRKYSDLGVFVKAQILTKSKPPPASVSFAGQTAIITGSNVGIGLETCRQMLKRGLSHLVMGVRSTAKAESEASKLRKSHPKAVIDVWPLDMNSYKSIQDFASRSASALSSLDIVILNAAVFNSQWKMSPTGHEETLQVNYLSTALLAILFLPLLKAKSSTGYPGRLMIASSNVAINNTFPSQNAVPLLPSFDNQEYYGTFYNRYAVSKMLVVMLTDKLSELVRPEDVIINTVDPGYTSGSDLHRSFSGGLSLMFSTLKTLTARTPEQAAWLYLDAVAVKGPESHGGYLMNSEICPFNPLMYTSEGKASEERLWDETLKELEFADAEKLIKSMTA
ncbi:hypothetical protein V2G26_017063 [Clonostachys chloroleuca]